MKASESSQQDPDVRMSVSGHGGMVRGFLGAYTQGELCVVGSRICDSESPWSSSVLARPSRQLPRFTCAHVSDLWLLFHPCVITLRLPLAPSAVYLSVGSLTVSCFLPGCSFCSVTAQKAPWLKIPNGSPIVYRRSHIPQPTFLVFSATGWSHYCLLRKHIPHCPDMEPLSLLLLPAGMAPLCLLNLLLP